MKTFMKFACIAAMALAMMTFGAAQARAWPVPIPPPGVVLGGVAVGAAASAPAYYAPPAYYASAPAYAAAPAYYYGPRVVVAPPFPYYRPYGWYGHGWAWGPHRYVGRPYYHRR